MKTKKIWFARARARPDQSVTQTKVSVRYALRENLHGNLLFLNFPFVIYLNL